jgi:antirestriction protein ArdC
MDPRLYEAGDLRYVTFVQAKEAGWSIRKGEKSLPVIFYKPVDRGTDSEDERDPDRPATFQQSWFARRATTRSSFTVAATTAVAALCRHHDRELEK